jgi:uncharacterized protein
MRPGLRGTLAIVGRALHRRDGSRRGALLHPRGRPSGDDYTGLLAIPAGFLLVGVGLVTLWKSRKGGSLVWGYARRGGLTLGLVIGLYLGLYPLAESYVSTHAARACVPNPELGAPVEGSRKPARVLVSHGYGVLLFDRRGEGESEGDPNLYGWRGTRDLRGAISYLESRPDVDPGRIGAIGLSVGGEMLLQAAAERDDFDAIVSEGAGIRSVREVVHHPGAVKAVVTWVSTIQTLGTSVFSSDLPPRSLTNLSAEISEPLLVIYSEKGQGGEKLSRQYYDAATGPKELWSAPERTSARSTQPRGSTSAALRRSSTRLC